MKGRPKKQNVIFSSIPDGLWRYIQHICFMNLDVANPNNWTIDITNQVSNIIIKNYKNPTTSTLILGKLRKELKLINCNNTIINLTKRPLITVKHNEISTQSIIERRKAGIDIPNDFYNLTELKNRVISYIESQSNEDELITPAFIVDLLIILVARPTELLTLQINENNKLIGILKKRGNNKEWDFPNIIGIDLGISFLTLWNKISIENKKKYIKPLLNYTKQKYNLQPRDFRAIGAELSVIAAEKSSIQDNISHNTSYNDNIRILSLRHETPKLRPVDCYNRVNRQTNSKIIEDIINITQKLTIDKQKEILEYII